MSKPEDNKLTYHCIYKDKCGHDSCVYANTDSKYSMATAYPTVDLTTNDLTIKGFKCPLIGYKRILLTSTDQTKNKNYISIWN